MEFQKLIESRRSVRKYADKPVEKEKVEKLLRRAMQAPSATNQQPWEFIVVDDKELLKKLSSFSPYSKFVADAPLAMVLLNRTGLRAQGHVPQDMGACMENLLLQAGFFETNKSGGFFRVIVMQPQSEQKEVERLVDGIMRKSIAKR